MLKWIVIVAAVAFCAFEIFSLVRDIIKKRKKKKEDAKNENGNNNDGK